MGNTKQRTATPTINPNPGTINPNPPVIAPQPQTTIPILEELEQAYEDYPHVYLELSLVDVDFPGGVIDEGDDVGFRIQAINRGPLDMNELGLLVTGLNGTEVKSNGAAAQWADSFEVSGSYFGNVLGHNGNNPVVSGGNKFHFRPGSAAGGVKDLVRVEVLSWNSDGSHLENAHTRADPEANVVYRADVSPA
jgi:hypothetical protein